MTWWGKKIEKVDPFIEELKEKGCHYNEDEDCWERVWLVATKNGSERSREVYKKST